MAEEAERDLIKARRHSQDYGLLLLPEEVLRASVHRLDFPGHCVSIGRQAARLPEPPRYAVLLAQRLIYHILLGHRGRVILLVNLLLDLKVHLGKGLVYIFNIYKECQLTRINTYLISSLAGCRRP